MTYLEKDELIKKAIMTEIMAHTERRVGISLKILLINVKKILEDQRRKKTYIERNYTYVKEIFEKENKEFVDRLVPVVKRFYDKSPLPF